MNVGLIGSGFVTELHMYAYKRVYGVDAKVVRVASLADDLADFTKKHQIPRITRDYKDLLADKQIDVIDICTPPSLHAPMIVDAVRVGKHVICEKPFTGYFGVAGDCRSGAGALQARSRSAELPWSAGAARARERSDRSMVSGVCGVL